MGVQEFRVQDLGVQELRVLSLEVGCVGYRFWGSFNMRVQGLGCRALGYRNW